MAATSYGRLLGYKIEFHDKISIIKQKRKMLLNMRQFTFIPFMIKLFSYYYNIIESKPIDGWDVLDFSGPGVHRYRKTGEEFAFPSIPEDDSIDAYTNSFKPSGGMTVFDVGAHAGTITCTSREWSAPRAGSMRWNPTRRACSSCNRTSNATPWTT